jgi:hypothetical protein
MLTNVRLEEEDINEAERVRCGALRCQLDQSWSEAPCGKAPMLMRA